MNNNDIVLIITLILCFVIVFSLTLLVIKYKRIRRVLDFSLEEKEKSSFMGRVFFDISDFIERLVIFNSVARTYDRFVGKDSRFRKGMDYLVLKVIIALFILLFYSLSSILYFHSYSISVAILLFVLGFVSVDFYLFYTYGKKNIISREALLEAIIVMNNGFKASRSIDDVLKNVIVECDGALKKHFIGIYEDYKMGFTLSEAFSRFYDKYKDSRIKFVADRLKLYEEGVSLSVIFDNIELTMLKNDKVERKLDSIKNINLFITILIVFMPIIVVSIIVMSNKSFIDALVSDIGFAIILIELIVYLLYLFFVRIILKGRYL